ncbi:MAG TPA: ABC transporter ATP-binding protein [Methylomirabilota bacterium]|nr:ABC transporter ATP-binding protein [Methylomirabilota bacterium]
MERARDHLRDPRRRRRAALPGLPELESSSLNGRLDVLSLEGVGFAYPGNPPLLRDISLRVREGEVVAVVGPTGCGKSTLLHICSGVVPHFVGGDLSGTVRVFGMETRESTLARLAARMGVVTQDPENQLFNLIVADEVVWGMENRGFTRAEMRERLPASLDFFRVGHLRDRITYDLSGGEKQRVVLAANHAPGPSLYVLDDPTSQLDPIGAEQVLAGLRGLAHSGSTILLVEAKLDELWSLVDRVVLLDRGTIQLDIPRDELDHHLEHFSTARVPLPQLVELGARLRRRGLPVPELPPEPDRVAAMLHPFVHFLPQTPAPSPAPASPPGPPAVRVQAVQYVYPPPRRTHALRGVDLELPGGSVVAVVGQNGSGKTTLARCLSGNLAPTSGLVLVAGRDVHRMSVRERASAVGYVFQNPDHQIFKDPVLEDVAFGPRNLGGSRGEALDAAEPVLRALDLWDQRDLHPFRLSKGQRQRLAIAAIAVMRPPVIVIDEPTTGQDFHESHAIMAMLAQMAREGGQTVVVITHAMHLVAAHCDMVAALCEGELIAFGPPAEVFRDEPNLRRTFVKPPPVTALANRLGLYPLPLTLDDAEARMTAAFRQVAQG